MTELHPLIHAFYRDRYVEDDRLSRSGHGRLECLRTQELLRRWLPPTSVVLDVGGATGVHARHLEADPNLRAATFHFLARGTRQ